MSKETKEELQNWLEKSREDISPATIISSILSDNTILFIIGLIFPGFLPIIHNISNLGNDRV